MDDRVIKNLDEQTPVDTIHNVGDFDTVLFKRDDLFLPFEDTPRLGGGKVRQAFSLFSSLSEKLKRYNGISSYVSVSSPQAMVVTRTAKEFGYKTFLVVGVNSSVENIIEKYRPIRECYRIGAEIHNLAKIGYNTVIKNRAKKFLEENNLYLVNFGINVDENTEALVGSVADQVKNVPDNLDAVIVPVGSGIQFASIIAGIKKYNKNVDRIIGIQISGYDRTKDINYILDKLNIKCDYEFYIDRTYPYTKHITTKITNTEDFSKSFEMNVVYESKAWKALLRERYNLKRTDKILFWIVGNNNYLYI
ncbi:MAG TPA: pyridoxal-phosphate dependent enzyme [Bacteroidales bacterium]|nr:pyridoxal-phosphate dependent enzyme [Bacteroidales bacterium]